jgi:hypothetical protein
MSSNILRSVRLPSPPGAIVLFHKVLWTAGRITLAIAVL